MIFSVVILLLILAVAYFHYAQGLFSATLSAILVVLSAVFAVAYHETVAEKLLNGKMGDSGDGIFLCLLFVVTYVVLRIIFDKAVPGNVAFPLAVDRVGGALMGLVAGIFATGVVALAAQSLGFGAQVAGYAPFDLSGATAVTIPTDQQYLDSTIYDAMKDGTLDPAKEKTTIIPVAEILLSTVQRLSDGGALAGDQPLSAVHPDYVRELFGNRIGVQVGAKHTALNIPGSDQIKLDALYALTALPAVDAELKQIRGADYMKPKVVTPSASQVLLVARLTVEASAADDADRLFRFSPGSVRLVANQKDYFPIGTVDSGDLLMLDRPDDFLFLDTGSGAQAVDVAYLVDKADLLGSSASNTKVLDGTFINVKRMARLDLSGVPIQGGYAASDEVKPLRKKAMAEQLRKDPPPSATIRSAIATPAEPAGAPRRTSGYRGVPSAPTAAAPSTPAAPTPTASSGAKTQLAGAVGAAVGSIGFEIPLKVGVNTSDGEAQDVAVGGGTISLKDSRIASASIEPTVSTDKLATGDSTIAELFVPDGKQLIQVTARPSASVPQLIDSTGTSTPANGYFGTVTTAAGPSAFLHYYADRPVSSITAPPVAPKVTYLFVVPSGVNAAQLSINGTSVPVSTGK